MFIKSGARQPFHPETGGHFPALWQPGIKDDIIGD